MDLLHEEEEKPNGRQKAQRLHTLRHSKRYISLVSLLLCCKIMAVRCFDRCLGLRMWSSSETVRQALRKLDEISSFYDLF